MKLDTCALTRMLTFVFFFGPSPLPSPHAPLLPCHPHTPAGARPPVRVSQVLSPEEVRRREREELKASLLSTLKGVCQ